MATTTLTDSTFERVVRGDGIVLVDFWASWCGPCRMFAPVFEKAATANPDIVFGKIDIETERNLSAAAGIRSIPTLMVFRDGILVFSQPGYAIAVIVERPFAQVLDATRDALAAEGFGVLTEIDMQATLKAKMGADIAPQVILGACRPPLAHAALLAEPSIGLLLPCNVVVRSVDGDRTRVETIDPAIMVSLTGNPDLQAVATDARARLTSALNSLIKPPTT